MIKLTWINVLKDGTRRIQEAIWIRRERQTMNRGEGVTGWARLTTYTILSDHSLIGSSQNWCVTIVTVTHRRERTFLQVSVITISMLTVGFEPQWVLMADSSQLPPVAKCCQLWAYMPSKVSSVSGLVYAMGVFIYPMPITVTVHDNASLFLHGWIPHPMWVILPRRCPTPSFHL